MSLTTSLLTAGANSHQESSETANGLATDLMSAGVIGTCGNTGGVAPTTGGFSVNAQGSPDMTVAVGTGVAYVTATPSSQGSQNLRVKNSASVNVTISANASGSTKYDWLYIKVDATLAAAPDVNATTVATLVTSRSSSQTTDNGTPPTYGTLLAVITVANGASSITNGTITDKRNQAVATSTTYTPYFSLFNFIESGCVWSGDAYASTLNASMTTGYVWIGGKRLLVPAVTARAFTASKDTYVDLKDSGDGVNASISYTEATTNAASSALAGSGTTADTVRCAIIVSGAGNIAAVGSVNQGQETKVLPIASSIPYAVTDSLGNLICPRDPNRKTIGYKQLVSNLVQTSVGTSAAASTGLSVPVIIPTGRKIKITVHDPQLVSSGAAAIQLTVWDGLVGSGTIVANGSTSFVAGFGSVGVTAMGVITPTSSSKTYSVAVNTASGSVNITHTAGATLTPFILVELQ